MRLNCLLTAVLSLFSSVLVAQGTAYGAFATDAAMETRLLQALEARYKSDVAGLQGEYKKYIAEIYEDRYESVKQTITGREVLLDAGATAYLQSIVDLVLKSNPSVKGQELRVLFSRSPEMNACSMGEGTLLINIGLFHRLRNESELAFAVCHEMAHYYLNHGNGTISKLVSTLYGKDFQEQLRQIRKQEYGRNKQLGQLLKAFAFRTRRHSREHEEAADSMAFELLKNSPFDLHAAIDGLSSLDSSEQPKYKPLPIDRQLSFPGFAFRKSWLDNDNDLVFAAQTTKKDSIEADSLQTHPDVSKRVARLRERVQQAGIAPRRAYAVNEKEFNTLRQRFDYEIIQYCIDNNDISAALYFTLAQLSSQPKDAWLNATAGRCFNELYARQKAHQLGKVVSLPSKHRREDYNQLLQMIQNLRLTDIAALSWHFLKQNETALVGYEPFAKEWTIAQQNFRN